MGRNDSRPLKAFVRFDGTGRIVAGSLILRRKMPKVGKWLEIPAYECCNPTTTTTTTFLCVNYGIVVAEGDLANLSYINCDNTPAGPFELTGPLSDTFCAKQDSYLVDGTAEVTALGYCTTTTTTTQLPG